MPAKHDPSSAAARRKYLTEKRKKFNLNLSPDEFDRFQAACTRRGTTPTTEIRKFMAQYSQQED